MGGWGERRDTLPTVLLGEGGLDRLVARDRVIVTFKVVGLPLVTKRAIGPYSETPSSFCTATRT